MTRFGLFHCFLATILLSSLASGAFAQTAGLGLHPARYEVVMQPGQEKTVAYEVESPTSDSPVRGRLLLSPSDWTIDSNGTASYLEPADRPNSASSWIAFSPSSMTISSGERQLVRVTVRVPEQTKGGVYTTAVMMQERPPATPPKAGEHNIFLRFRYAFTLYVIVPPVTLSGELVDIRVEGNERKIHLVCEMENTGSQHLRPSISWSIRNGSDVEVAALLNHESTVLLPFSRLRESFSFPDDLPNGTYKVSLRVDFGDGHPLQGATREVNYQGNPPGIRNDRQ